MRRAARAGGGKVEAGALLGGFDEVAQIVIGRVLGHHDHRRCEANHHHGLQSIVLERHGLLDHAVGDDAGRADQQGVAIGLGLGHDIGTYGATRARTIVDHHGLAKDLGGAFGRRSGHQVIGAACGKRHHEANRTRGPVGGLGQAGCAQHGKSQGLGNKIATVQKHGYLLDPNPYWYGPIPQALCQTNLGKTH